MSREQRNRNRLLEEHDASGFEHFAFGADDYDRDALAALLDDRPRYPQEPFETLRGQPGYLYFPPADVEPRSDLYVDGVYDPHANDVTERTLQREVRTPGSGGGGSKGRLSKKKAVSNGKRVNQAIPDDIVQSHLPTLRVPRLTLFTYHFFLNQPELALRELSDYADEILKNGYPRGPFPRFSKLRTTSRPLMVVGLPERKIMALKANPGAAKRRLIEYARSSQADRARLIDGG